MGLFVSTSDVMEVFGCSYTTAWKRLQVIKGALGKEKHQKITVKEFIEYEGLTMEEFNESVKIKK